YLLGGFWFFREDLIALFFIIIGFLMKKPLLAFLNKSTVFVFAGFILLLLTTLATFDLNFFANKHMLGSRDAVVMSVSQHGHFLLFIFTALSGSLMLILLSRCIFQNQWMQFFGQNTLILLAMAGFYLHFIIVNIAQVLPDDIGVLLTIFLSIVIALIQILLSWPVIVLCNRDVPQLIGQWPSAKPKRDSVEKR
ncbi:MAG: hypothetical protein HRU20_17345, partial [Pseudomonadales bacterium]|nr:hypothetical protein [Pseudomonadales bacterium]